MIKKVKAQDIEVLRWTGDEEELKKFCGEDLYSFKINGQGSLNIHAANQAVGVLLIRRQNYLVRCGSGQYYQMPKELLEELVETAE